MNILWYILDTSPISGVYGVNCPTDEDSAWFTEAASQELIILDQETLVLMVYSSHDGGTKVTRYSATSHWN